MVRSTVRPAGRHLVLTALMALLTLAYIVRAVMQGTDPAQGGGGMKNTLANVAIWLLLWIPVLMPQTVVADDDGIRAEKRGFDIAWSDVDYLALATSDRTGPAVLVGARGKKTLSQASFDPRQRDALEALAERHGTRLRGDEGSRGLVTIEGAKGPTGGQLIGPLVVTAFAILPLVWAILVPTFTDMWIGAAVLIAFAAVTWIWTLRTSRYRVALCADNEGMGWRRLPDGPYEGRPWRPGEWLRVAWRGEDAILFFVTPTGRATKVHAARDDAKRFTDYARAHGHDIID